MGVEAFEPVKLPFFFHQNKTKRNKKEEKSVTEHKNFN